MDLRQKTKLKYLRLYIVYRRTEGGSYMIAKLDETVAKYQVAAFWLVPYFVRKDVGISVEELVGTEGGEVLQDLEEDKEDW